VAFAIFYGMRVRRSATFYLATDDGRVRLPGGGDVRHRNSAAAARAMQTYRASRNDAFINIWLGPQANIGLHNRAAMA